MKGRKKTVGFSLLEVLVSLVIVSIGALGFTKAQVNALRSISDTMSRTTANILVQDMVARIEANPAAAWLSNANQGYLNAAGAIDTNCISETTICKGETMARHDIADWHSLIAEGLPAGMAAVGTVCLESPAGSVDFANPTTCSEVSTAQPVVYTVRIYWKSSGNGLQGNYDQVEVATVQAPLSRTLIYPLPDDVILKQEDSPDAPLDI